MRQRKQANELLHAGPCHADNDWSLQALEQPSSGVKSLCKLKLRVGEKPGNGMLLGLHQSYAQHQHVRKKHQQHFKSVVHECAFRNVLSRMQGRREGVSLALSREIAQID